MPRGGHETYRGGRRYRPTASTCRFAYQRPGASVPRPPPLRKNARPWPPERRRRQPEPSPPRRHGREHAHLVQRRLGPLVEYAGIRVKGVVGQKVQRGAVPSFVGAVAPRKVGQQTIVQSHRVGPPSSVLSPARPRQNETVRAVRKGDHRARHSEQARQQVLHLHANDSAAHKATSSHSSHPLVARRSNSVPYISVSRQGAPLIP